MEASRKPSLDKVEYPLTPQTPEEYGISELEELTELTEALLVDGIVEKERVSAILTEMGLEAESDNYLAFLESRGIEVIEADVIPKTPGTTAEAADQSFSHDSLQLFLIGASRYPLLTAAQEVELAKQKDVYLPFRELIQALTTERHLKDGETHELLEQMTEELPAEDRQAILRGELAYQRLMNSNLRLVVSIAKNYRGLGVPFLDLIQEGVLGLNRAVEKFDWRKGYKFSTYATWWIRQSVQRAIANHARTIRVPVHVVERQQKITRASRRLLVELGREPTVDELVAATGLSKHHVKEALEAAQASVSLNQYINDAEESELGDFFADKDSLDPFDEAEESLRKEAVRKALGSLPERERRILELRFGFEGEPWTLEAIGHEMDLTRERVRQLENQAVRRLAATREMQSIDSHQKNGATGIESGTENKTVTLRNPTTLRVVELRAGEYEVLSKMLEGKSEREIAKDLGIAQTSVRTRKYAASNKLRVNQDNLLGYFGRLERIDRKTG